LGQKIHKIRFSDEDFIAFNQKLQSDLAQLELLCQTPSFGGASRSYGAEVELYIVGPQYSPQPINQAIEQASKLQGLTLELNQYNLEYNFKPVAHSPAPFSALEEQWVKAQLEIHKTAQTLDANILTIGILPTLTEAHLGRQVITDEPRYLALDSTLREHHHVLPFSIILNGIDHVNINLDDVSAEGANTSFQFHYRCPYEKLTATFNAAQLTAAIVLAAAGNSPFFLGQRLWQETRIGLFKQAVDTRAYREKRQQLPQRVHFGFGWLRESIFEIFEQNVALFKPLLPECAEGHKPFNALQLHQGCIWPWIRPVLDAGTDSHIRLEFRALPSGPSATDMLANAAMCIGLVEGLLPHLNAYLNSLPFNLAENNFYRAAQQGLSAEILWPKLNANLDAPHGSGLKAIQASDLILELLPIMDQGLASIGIDQMERDKYVRIIEQRVLGNQTGAQWQLKRFETLIKTLSHEQALKALVKEYHDQSLENIPVSKWSL